MMRVKQGFVMRDVAGQTVIVATGEASKSFQGMIRVNPTGKVIWQGLTDGLTDDQIVDNILKEFAVERDVAAKDVATFIEQARDNGFLA